jgi:hypothetical protein
MDLDLDGLVLRTEGVQSGENEKQGERVNPEGTTVHGQIS